MAFLNLTLPSSVVGLLPLSDKGSSWLAVELSASSKSRAAASSPFFRAEKSAPVWLS